MQQADFTQLHNNKVSDEQFLSILAENAGLYAKTAKAIEAQLGVKYTRQAVYQRAKNFPKEVEQIKETCIDMAEDGLLTLMKSENETVRLKAIELYLLTQGSKRGYYKKKEIGLNEKTLNTIADIINAGDTR